MFLKIESLQTDPVGEYTAVPTVLRRERGADLSRVCEDRRGFSQERGGYRGFATSFGTAS